MTSPTFPINIGIIGLGHIGKYHIQALAQFQELHLAAACDLDPKLAQLLPKTATFYDRVDQLLGNPNIGTVIVATPNDTHSSLASSSLEAGKNVIVEKPAATNFKEFQTLDHRFAQSEQHHIYYAFHAAKAFDVAWFKQHYTQPDTQQRLGPITAFACHFYDPYVYEGQIKPEARSLGNSWIDSGVNALSVLSEFLDLNYFTPVSVTLTSPFEDTTPVQGLVQYQFPIGAAAAGGLGFINTNWTLGINRKETWLGFGQTGYQIKLDHSRQQVLEISPTGKDTVLQDFSQTGDRLLNHYLGVFKVYLASFKNQQFNSEQSRLVHHLLYYFLP